MKINNKQIIDFPDGLLFVGSESDPYLRKPRKKVDFNAALEYAQKAWEEGRKLTFEEMQQFIIK